MTKNILLTGIGGQGTITASKLLTIGLMSAGYDVKMSEVHGMSQREGQVLTHLRYGDKVYSPVVPQGEADIIMGFEELEVLRNIDYLREDGVVVLNTARFNPIGVLSGKDKYPENTKELIEARAGKVYAFDASEEAKKLGNQKVMNIILLGTIIKKMNLEEIDWDKIIEENVKEKFIEINKKALRVGIELV
ncbi:MULTISPECIES: indolepyruvate oxidoreductase subunit beta [Peptostreptococcus]|uniref:indolepyruvate oxidoreductase subunit beta n=1 Tax=Peptostreptococcus TaxID=1257 RepID=UPI00189C3AA7|nr:MULTISPECIES: indolepyruvate oxidoreductase subunit beta [Peptostreptococcus]MBS5597130.1 indolepyruvate oxidoreductase subunit beta [Peptostreptococcus sp.]MCB6982156.1 indolepyruvate oxidoreductase subunit beta [Peptostreptococcus anaerobius]MCQ5149847.1 indolepyruvate oxidoreductase subunit beta [Peptostreptococcus anaerobius]MDB8852699.1 indolepyruvate oxidoreductase subunit beta [Peptostreptococcus anaerobius]